MKSSVIGGITAAAIVVPAVLYNLIPFLIYLTKQYLLPKAKKARQLDPKSLSSPWVRVCSKNSGQKVLVDECSTVAELFSKSVKQFKDRKSFGCRQVLSEENEKQSDGKVFKKLILGDYQWFTSGQIDQRVEVISKGFLHIGVKPYDKVMIFGETRLEWMLSCQSLFRIGATVATLYSTLGEDGIVYGINQTKVKHLIANYDLLEKLKNVLDQLKHIECIVYMDGYQETNIGQIFTQEQRKKVKFHSLKQVEESGKSHKELKGSAPKAEDIAVVMYTSGSTGIPKGVMISHMNLLTAVRAFNTLSEHLTNEDMYCAFLPLAHILEMSAEIFFISNGLSVGFATVQTLTDNSTAIKKGTKGDTALLKPTVIAAVPLVMDRIKKAITDQLAKRSLDTPLINFLFCRTFRQVLGGRIRFIAVGGAPLSPETHEFVRVCFNVSVIQGYGLTETSASGTLMPVEDLSVGSVGPPLEGIQIKLIDWEEGNYKITDKPNPRGEVVLGGHNITTGYFNNDELTKESYKEEDGLKWFQTGDVGEMLSDGSLKIIDRKKDIIKLATGEYLSLAKIEAELKKNPLVENVCVYGHSSKDFVIAFIIPNQKQLKTLAQSVAKESNDFKSLCEDSDVNQKAMESIQNSLKQSKLIKVEIPRKIKLCSDEWTAENGLVTAALKLRRKNIQEFYQNDINQMYGIQEVS